MPRAFQYRSYNERQPGYEHRPFDSPEDVVATLYVLHVAGSGNYLDADNDFQPLHHLGWTPNIYRRITEHVNFAESHFGQRARKLDRPILLGYLGQGTIGDEQALRPQAHNLCSVCQHGRITRLPEPRTEDEAKYLYSLHMRFWPEQRRTK